MIQPSESIRDELMDLKWQIYRIVFILTLISSSIAVAGTMQGYFSGSRNSDNLYFGLVSVTLLAGAIFKLLSQARYELLAVTLFVCGFVGRMLQAVLIVGTPDEIEGFVANTTPWTPVLFILMFIMLPPLLAVRVGFITFLSFLFIGVIGLVSGRFDAVSSGSCDLFLQMYIFGNGISLLLLSVLVKNYQYLHAVELDNVSNWQASRTDSLTQLFNRRHLQLMVDQGELSGTYYVLMIDIDHFKRINDTFGHEVGDSTLSALARLLRESSRSDQHIARWGGEEFVVFFYGEKKEALAYASRLRSTVESTDFSVVGKLTISIGVARKSLDEEFGDAVQRADQSMYNAKNAGRNKVYFGDAEV